MIINQELNRDFGIMDKITVRLENDITLLSKQVQIKELKKGKYQPVDLNSYIQYLCYYIKLIDGPFFRKIRSNTAPILSRKLVDSQLLKLLANEIVQNKNIAEKSEQPNYYCNQMVFLYFLILVGDICRECPNLIDRLIEENVIESIFIRLSHNIPNDQESIPMVVYFLNMACLIQKGHQLEQKYKIIDKLFNLFMDKDYVDTFF